MAPVFPGVLQASPVAAASASSSSASGKVSRGAQSPEYQRRRLVIQPHESLSSDTDSAEDKTLVPREIVIPYEEASVVWENRLFTARPAMIPLHALLPKQDPRLHTMNRTEDLATLTTEPFFVSNTRCPLFNHYADVQVVGQGGYGLVLRATRRHTQVRYAIKFQRIAAEDVANPMAPPYAELRLMYDMNRMIQHWPPMPAGLPGRFYPANFIGLYDWVRCKLNLRKVMYPLLDRETQEKANIKALDNHTMLYQIIVMDYAAQGSLAASMRSQTRALYGSAEDKFMRSMFTQVFGTLYKLNRVMRFVWHDCKPDNILMQTQPNWVPYDTLVYDVGDGLTLYLPLADSYDTLFLISDLGISRGRVQKIVSSIGQDNRSLSGTPVRATEPSADAVMVVSDASPVSAEFNPRSDTELFVITYLSVAMTAFGDMEQMGPQYVPRFMSDSVVQLLRDCLHYAGNEEITTIQTRYGIPFNGAWGLDTLDDIISDDHARKADYHQDYAILYMFMDYLAGSYTSSHFPVGVRMAMESPDSFLQYKAWYKLGMRVRVAIHNIYHHHRSIWIVKKHPLDVNCIPTIFQTNALFAQLKTPPSGFSKGMHRINDLRVPTTLTPGLWPGATWYTQTGTTPQTTAPLRPPGTKRERTD